MKRILVALAAGLIMILSVVLCCCGEDANADGGTGEDPAACTHEFGAWYVTVQPTCS